MDYCTTGKAAIITTPSPPRRSRVRGFSLLEVLFALALFTLVLIIFGATFPSALRGSGQASYYMQAAILARHKSDQLRLAGYNHLKGTDLYQLGITDSATANSDGSFSFTNIDHLADSGTTKGFFGASTNVSGTVLISQALTSQGSSAPSAAIAEQVTITITWSGGGVHSGSYTTHTILARP